MMNIYIYLLLLSCMGNWVFSQGIGMEMTEDGTGLYYKQLWSLDNISHLTGDVGIHFDNSKRKIDIFRYDNNYQYINATIGKEALSSIAGQVVFSETKKC